MAQIVKYPVTQLKKGRSTLKMRNTAKLNILAKKKIGDMNWIEFRELKEGANAFKEIHDGPCAAPKIILIP